MRFLRRVFKCLVGLAGLLIAVSPTLAATRYAPTLASEITPSYKPHLTIKPAGYFNQGRFAMQYDLWLPILQNSSRDKLLFTDFRVFDRAGPSLEGNAHLGFRKELNDGVFGFYAAFDRRRSNLFCYSQFTAGFELWQNRWFLGGNIYQPIGKKEHLVWREIAGSEIISRYEKAYSGFDFQLGREIGNLRSYLGYYSFHKIKGARAQIEYNYTPAIPGISRLTLELGAQTDRRGTAGFIGLSIRFGDKDRSRSSHMTDLVRRDPDIVVDSYTAKTAWRFYVPPRTAKEPHDNTTNTTPEPSNSSNADDSSTNNANTNAGSSDQSQEAKYDPLSTLAWALRELGVTSYTDTAELEDAIKQAWRSRVFATHPDSKRKVADPHDFKYYAAVKELIDTLSTPEALENIVKGGYKSYTFPGTLEQVTTFSRFFATKSYPKPSPQEKGKPVEMGKPHALPAPSGETTLAVYKDNELLGVSTISESKPKDAWLDNLGIAATPTKNSVSITSDKPYTVVAESGDTTARITFTDRLPEINPPSSFPRYNATQLLERWMDQNIQANAPGHRRFYELYRGQAGFGEPFNADPNLYRQKGDYPLLDKFVKEHGNNPLFLAEFVQNHVKLDITLSALRVPEVCFLDKAGSPLEQSILLEAMLRMADYPAVVVLPKNFLLLTLNQVDILFGFNKQKALGLQRAAMPWVKYFDGNQWLDLFPWLKEEKWRSGAFKIPPADIWLERYIKHDPELFKDIKGLDDSVEHALKKYLSAQGYDKDQIGSIREDGYGLYHTLNSLPKPLAYPLSEVEIYENPQYNTLIFSVLGTDIKLQLPARYWLSQGGYGYFTGQELVFRMAGKNGFTGPTEDFVPPYINIQERRFSVPNRDLELMVQIDGFSNNKPLVIHPGEYFAPAFNLNEVSIERLNKIINTPATTDQDRLGKYLNIAIFRYFAGVGKGASWIHKKLDLPKTSVFQSGLIALGKTDCPRLDAPSRGVYEYSLDISELGKYIIALISSHEHLAIENSFPDQHAASTVRLLGQDFLKLNHAKFWELDRDPQSAIKNADPVQWNILRQAFSDSRTTAWITKGLVTYHNYRGMGSLIFTSNKGWLALISDKNYLLNGGYGSKLPSNFNKRLTNLPPLANNLKQNVWDSFTEFKPFKPTFDFQEALNEFQKPKDRPIYDFLKDTQPFKNPLADLDKPSASSTSSSFDFRSAGEMINSWRKILDESHTPLEQHLPNSPLTNPLSSSDPLNPADDLPNNPFVSTPSLETLLKFDPHKLALDDYLHGRIKPSSFDDRLKEYRASYNKLYDTLKSELPNDLNNHIPSDLPTDSQTSPPPASLPSLISIKAKAAWDEISDPVDIITGAYTEEVTELDRAIGPTFRRSYHSQSEDESYLGYGWRGDYAPMIPIDEDLIMVTEPDGTSTIYRNFKIYPEDNTHISNLDDIINNYITREGDSLILHEKSGFRKYQNWKLIEQERFGQYFNLIYDNDHLTKVTDGTRWIKFSYELGRLSKIEDELGRWASYHYKGSDLIKVRYFDHSWIKYKYDNHRIISVRKPLGWQLVNIYRNNQVVEQQVAKEPGTLTVDTRFEYLENERKVIDPLGKVTTYKLYDNLIYLIIDPLGDRYEQDWYLSDNRLLMGGQIYSRNHTAPHRRLLATRDFSGFDTHYIYKDGLLTWSYDRNSTTDWYYQNRTLTSKRLRAKNHAEYTNYLNNTLEITEPNLHAHIQLKNNLPTFKNITSGSSTTIQNFDAYGRMTNQTIDGELEEFTYDRLGYLREHRRPKESTIYDRDLMGRPLKITTGKFITEYSYDIAGNCIRSSEQGYAAAKITDYYYNALRQLIRETIDYGTFDLAIKDGKLAVTQKDQPLSDRLVREYSYTALGYLSEVSSSDGKSAKNFYDPIGQLINQQLWDFNEMLDSYVYNYLSRNLISTFHNGLLDSTAPPPDPYYFISQDPLPSLLQNWDNLAADGLPLFDHNWYFEYNKARKLSHIRRVIGDQIIHKENRYDHLNRLTTKLENGNTVEKREYLQSTEKRTFLEGLSWTKDAIGETSFLNSEPIRGTVSLSNYVEDLNGIRHTASEDNGTVTEEITKDGELLGFTKAFWQNTTLTKLLASNFNTSTYLGWEHDSTGRTTAEGTYLNDQLLYSTQQSWYNRTRAVTLLGSSNQILWSFNLTRPLPTPTPAKPKAARPLPPPPPTPRPTPTPPPPPPMPTPYPGDLETVPLTVLSTNPYVACRCMVRRVFIDLGNMAIHAALDPNDPKVCVSHFITFADGRPDACVTCPVIPPPPIPTPIPTPFFNPKDYEPVFIDPNPITPVHIFKDLAYPKEKYDALGRVIQNSGVGFLVNYQYDGNNLLASLEHFTNNQLTHSHRLISRTAHFWQDHLFTPRGSFTVNSTLDKMGRVTEKAYVPQGQIAPIQNTTFIWDSFDHLFAVTNSDLTWQATYDALGRQLQTNVTNTKTNRSYTTTKYYDPEYSYVLLGASITQNNQTYHVALEPKMTSEGIDEIHGPAKLRLKKDGDETWQEFAVREEHQDLYGYLDNPATLADLIDPNQDPNAVIPRLFFQGKLREETGLVDFGARYYDPEMGRFISPDPLLHETSRDLYAYADGDPITGDYNGYFSSFVYKHKMDPVFWMNTGFEAARIVNAVFFHPLDTLTQPFRDNPQYLTNGNWFQKSYAHLSRGLIWSYDKASKGVSAAFHGALKGYNQVEGYLRRQDTSLTTHLANWMQYNKDQVKVILGAYQAFVQISEDVAYYKADSLTKRYHLAQGNAEVARDFAGNLAGALAFRNVFKVGSVASRAIKTPTSLPVTHKRTFARTLKDGQKGIGDYKFASMGGHDASTAKTDASAKVSINYAQRMEQKPRMRDLEVHIKPKPGALSWQLSTLGLSKEDISLILDKAAIREGYVKGRVRYSKVQEQKLGEKVNFFNNRGDEYLAADMVILEMPNHCIKVKRVAMKLLHECGETIHDQKELKLFFKGQDIQVHHFISRKGYADMLKKLRASGKVEDRNLADALEAMGLESPANKGALAKSADVAEITEGAVHRGPHPKEALDRVKKSIRDCATPDKIKWTPEEKAAIDKVPWDSKADYALRLIAKREKEGLLTGKFKVRKE